MYTVTAIFRHATDAVTFIEIGGIDTSTGNPTWFSPHPIVGPNTTDDWEAIARPLVERFASVMGITGLHGGRLAFTADLVAVMEFDFDSSEPEQDESLGPCGCTDYHMADCPTRTDSFRPYEPFDFYDDDRNPVFGD